MNAMFNLVPKLGLSFIPDKQKSAKHFPEHKLMQITNCYFANREFRVYYVWQLQQKLLVLRSNTTDSCLTLALKLFHTHTFSLVQFIYIGSVNDKSHFRAIRKKKKNNSTL